MNKPQMGPVPLLGAKQWKCNAGHVYTGNLPFRFSLPIGPQQALTSGPLCPVCLLDWMAFTFPAWDANLTMEEAVAAGELNPRVLPKNRQALQILGGSD